MFLKHSIMISAKKNKKGSKLDFLGFVRKSGKIPHCAREKEIRVNEVGLKIQDSNTKIWEIDSKLSEIWFQRQKINPIKR